MTMCISPMVLQIIFDRQDSSDDDNDDPQSNKDLRYYMKDRKLIKQFTGKGIVSEIPEHKMTYDPK